MHHLNDSTFLGLVAQTLPRGEARRAILHLLTCSRCEDHLLELYPLKGRLLLEYLLDEPAEQIHFVLGETRSALESGSAWALREAEHAAGLFEELRPLSPSHRRLRALNTSRFASIGLVARLLEEGRGNCHSAPEVAKSWALLACELVRRVAADAAPRKIRADIESRAWRHLGHSFRILGDYSSAQETLTQAEQLLRGGTGDLIERAEQRLFWMILLQDQARFDEGVNQGWQAHHLYWRAGRTRATARVEVSLAKHMLLAGRPQEAQELLVSFFHQFSREGVGAELYAVAMQNHILSSVSIGDTAKATNLLQELRQLTIIGSQPLIRARVDWAEGLVEAASGRPAAAERILRRVQQSISHLPADRAYAALDLANVLVRMNRRREAVYLARECEQTFESLGVRYRAQKAAQLARRWERGGPPEAAGRW